MKSPISLMPSKHLVSEESTVTNENTNLELLSVEEKKNVVVKMVSDLEIVESSYDKDALSSNVSEIIDKIANTEPEKLKHVKSVIWRQPSKLIIMPPEIDFELN